MYSGAPVYRLPSGDSRRIRSFLASQLSPKAKDMQNFWKSGRGDGMVIELCVCACVRACGCVRMRGCVRDMQSFLHSGVGMGLYACHKVMKAMDGWQSYCALEQLLKRGYNNTVA